MNMPEEFTVPQAAAYLKVSEETVRRNIRSKALGGVAQGNTVVHSPRRPYGPLPILTTRKRAKYDNYSSWWSR